MPSEWLDMRDNEGVDPRVRVPADEDKANGNARTRRVRLAIADDDPAILDHLAQILAPFEIVARAANGRLLVEAVDRTKPSVVVTDFSMPEMNGIEATRRILGRNPAVKVVFLSVHDDPAYVDAAFEAGASGYVLKVDANAELLDAVERVQSGGTYRSHRLA